MTVVAGPPVSSELFTPDQLEAYAARIAAEHGLSDNPRRARPLLPRLDLSSGRLDQTYLFLSAAKRHDTEPVGSEEWLRDNHHVVQDQVREIRLHLPREGTRTLQVGRVDGDENRAHMTGASSTGGCSTRNAAWRSWLTSLWRNRQVFAR